MNNHVLSRGAVVLLLGILLITFSLTAIADCASRGPNPIGHTGPIGSCFTLDLLCQQRPNCLRRSPSSSVGRDDHGGGPLAHPVVDRRADEQRTSQGCSLTHCQRGHSWTRSA